MVDLTLLDNDVMPQTIPALTATSDDDELLDELLDGPANISELDRVVCFLVARGLSYEMACERLGLDEKDATQMKGRKELFDLVLQIQTALRLNLGQQIRALAPLALRRKMELIMFSKNENVVNAAASFILEQAEGRAVQKVEVQSFNLNAKAESKEVDTALEATMTRLAKLEEEKKRLLESRQPVGISG